MANVEAVDTGRLLAADGGEAVALLRARLAAAPQAWHSDYDLNPGMRAEAPPPEALTPAAVLVPLVSRPEGMTVILTRRTDHLRDHAGQISFPGGRTEALDDGPEATALRETEEEIGLSPRFVRLVGRLAEYETRTGFSVTPIVGCVAPGFSLTLDRFEVAEVFEVPLAFVLDPRNHERRSRMWRGAERHFYVLAYGERFIWGATAGILVDLYRRLVQNHL